MDRPTFHQPMRRPNRNHTQYGPVVVIVVLLACWAVIAEWPEVASTVLSLANH